MVWFYDAKGSTDKMYWYNFIFVSKKNKMHVWYVYFFAENFQHQASVMNELVKFNSPIVLYSQLEVPPL